MEIWIDGKPGAAHWIVLAAIIVLAILVRVVAIDTQSLWTDEALTIVLANWSIGDMVLKPTDPTPFLYYALHKLLLPADASLFAIRSISLVAGILSVALMYALGRLAYGRAGGLLAAALLAVWSIHVDYSQEARAYSLLFLFTLLTSVGFLAYARALDRQPIDRADAWSGQGKLALALFGIGNVLAFYTHVVSALWIALTSLMLIALVARRQGKRIAEVAVVFLVMALCALPGLYRLLEQMKVGDGFNWVEQRGLVGFVRLCAEIFLPLGSWDTSAATGIDAAAVAKAIVMVTFVVSLGAGCWFGRHRIAAWARQGRPVLWLTLAYLLVPVIMWLLGFVGRPILIGRAMLFCVPGMILLITGIICLALDRRAATWAGVAAAALYGVSLLLTGTIREREDWRAAYEYLAGAAAPGDVVAICPSYNYPSLRYHATAPVAAAVVTTVDGRLAAIEGPLGSDPHWDRTYFETIERPLTMSRIAGGAGDSGAAGKLELNPAQSIWRVDGHCTEASADMDRALAAAGADTGIVRFQEDASGASAISIREYRVLAPATLEVQSLAARP